MGTKPDVSPKGGLIFTIQRWRYREMARRTSALLLSRLEWSNGGMTRREVILFYFCLRGIRKGERGRIAAIK